MTIRLPFVRHRRALSDVRVPYDSRVLRFRPDTRPLPYLTLRPSVTDHPSISDRPSFHLQPNSERRHLSPLRLSPSLPDLNDVTVTTSDRLRPLRLLLPRLDSDRERR